METITEQFKKFEQEKCLFEKTVNGIGIWERIRFGILREIKQQSGAGQAHTRLALDQRDNVEGAKLWLRNIFKKNPYLAPSSEMLFVGHPRRKKKEDGYWWDLYCDPIHESCTLDAVHFEMPHLLEHKSPAKTPSLRYLEFIHYSGTIQRKLGLYDVSLSEEDRSVLSEIERKIRDEFGASIDLESKVQRLLRNRDCRLWLYERLLDRVDPKIAVVVVSYGKHTFIEACKNKGVPVVELQHGVIYPNHLGYSFAGERTKTLFPDYLLTWGEFWSNDVEFPIPDDRVIPVGYPHLEQSARQYENTRSQGQILFISQGTIGEQLSKFAMEVDRHPDVDHDIVYKLHPGEYDRWRNEYPWLVDADFEVIDGSDPPLYELFARSSTQVGVGSTAIYEGLAFNLDTYVYDCPGSEILLPLIEDGAATLISSTDDLVGARKTKPNIFDQDRFFRSGATDRMCRTLNQLTNEGTTYQD